MKPLADFHKAASSKDGYRSDCKKCVSEGAGYTYTEREKLPEGQKRCKACGQIFPATSEYFKKEQRNKDGIAAICKTCATAYTKDYYQDNIEQVKAYNRQRYHANRDYNRQKTREWYQANKTYHRQKCKEWYEQNRESVREWNKQYYLANREQAIEKRRQWRKDNNERYRAYNADWFERNPEKARAIRTAHDVRRRARKRALPNTFKPQDWLDCLEYWGHQCAICGSTGKLNADHWIPLYSENCPGTVVDNMLVLCGHCNFTKNRRDPIKWLIEKLGEDAAAQKLAEIETYFEFVKSKPSKE
ncbi:MAG TPA: hypothetical protein VHO69_10495 [Phototrophicaceae bacterium]|nr:hypothetical protein [Phototrophicaceae bacterium]